MFNGLKKPRNLTQYKLMQGVTDFGNIAQFNLFEKGYSFLLVSKVPKFVEMLAAKDSMYKDLLDNYVHILEYEFRGLDGIENLTSDALEITNGISTVSMIGKVNEQSNSTVQMRFFEKSGSTITKFHQLFLTGIKDPKSQAKRYHGLIDAGELEDGYENEIFTLLYIVTDNTMLKVEKAYALLCAQPNSAEYSMYNSEKGQIENPEITVEMNCFPVATEYVYAEAQKALDWMNNPENPNYLQVQSSKFAYTGTSDMLKKK